MDTIAAGMILLYLVVTTLIGTALARRTRSSSDWALGGGMGLLMIAAGIAGTRIGGVGTYGVAGDVIKTGLWNLWYGVNTFLAMALVGIFYAIPYRRLRLSTVAEIFDRRFGSKRCQVLTSLCVQTEYFIINVIEPFIIGRIVQQVTGWPFAVGVAIGGFVIILYTAAGGLRGSSLTNMIHCSVIILGLLLVGAMGMRHLGGWDGLQSGVNAALETAGRDTASWWSFVGLGWGAVFGMFFSATVHTPGASVYVNFASSAKDERTVIPAFLLAGVIAATMPLLAGWIGMQTLAHYGADAQLASYTSITRLATEINPWIGGIALAAILAAVISSGGPILLSSSTMFVRDWLWFTRAYDERRKLRAYRMTTVIYGAVAATIAYYADIRSVLELLLLGFAMVVPPAVAVGYLIYWRRTSEAGAFWGMALGYGLGLLWFLAIQWAQRSGLDAPEGSGWLQIVLHRCFAHEGRGIDPSIVTTVVPVVAVPILSLMSPHDGRGQNEFYAQLARPSDAT
jgi:solute:Na+ symporter, SSS family